MATDQDGQDGLAQVTLCAITSRDVPLTEVALLRSAMDLDFGQVLLLSPTPPCSGSLQHVEIPPFTGIQDYCRFVLFELWKHIHTDFALIIHYDGFVLHPSSWDEQFLQYDYIGARWPYYSENQVGNGGFCLRSRRLLQATDDPRFNRFDIPEDQLICRQERPYLESELGFRFAPPEVADRFSIEYSGTPARSFGFHGLLHLHRAYSPEELEDVLTLMDPAVFKAPPALQWFQQLVDEGAHHPIMRSLAKAITQAQDAKTLAKNCRFCEIPPGEIADLLQKALNN